MTHVSPVSALGQPVIDIGIATKGRKEILAMTIDRANGCVDAPRRIIICPFSAEDVDVSLCKGRTDNIVIVPSPPGGGLPRQRNAILQFISEGVSPDVIGFLDDDYFVDPAFLGAIGQVFAADAAVVAANGRTLADGNKSGGLTPEQANAVLAGPADMDQAVPEIYSTYGCNMFFRVETLLTHGLRLDERLLAYAWLEDLDFSRRVRRCGKIVQVRAARGVHLANRGGRTKEVHLGYTQIINAVYIYRKGLIGIRKLANVAGKPFLANIVHYARPEPHVDRRGRLKGNLLGLRDVLRGRVVPENVKLL